MPIPNGFGDEDITTFFEDFGVPVYHTGCPGGYVLPGYADPGVFLDGTVGILDMATEDHDFPSQRSEVRVGISSVLLIVAAFTIALPKKNDPINVDGTNYFVNSAHLEGDGRTIRCSLRKA